MGIGAAPDAGSFEPRPCEFFSVTYPTGDAGGAPATPALFCKRYFRWQRTYGRELQVQAQTKAPQTIVIEVRKDSKTRLITMNMLCQIEGQEYGLTDIQPKPNDADFIVFTMATNNVES